MSEREARAGLGHDALEGRELPGVRAALFERPLPALERFEVATARFGPHRVDEQDDPIEQPAAQARGTAHELEIGRVEDHDRRADRVGGQRRRALALELDLAAPAGER